MNFTEWGSVRMVHASDVTIVYMEVPSRELYTNMNESRTETTLTWHLQKTCE